jgi:tripartite-type tricarboxylate transporter receptor subunit TctC
MEYLMLSRRSYLRLIAGAAAMLPTCAPLAEAQSWPARPITLIVPFAAGGATDVYARVIATHMGSLLGQQLVIENVGGAGGTTGSIRAMRGNPDGYTLLIGSSGTHAFAVALYPNLAYRPALDFAPIGILVETHYLIVARKDFPADTLREFAAYLKANERRMNMAHAGIGSNVHVVGILFNSVLGIKPTLVPFSGAGPATTALLAGQVDYMINGIAEVGEQVKAGTIKAYAYAAAERSPVLPNVPTTAEAGLPEFRPTSWWGLFAPKATPGPVLEKLANALGETLNDAQVQRRLMDIGADIPNAVNQGPEALASRVRNDIALWSPLIKAAAAGR